MKQISGNKWQKTVCTYKKKSKANKLVKNTANIISTILKLLT